MTSNDEPAYVDMDDEEKSRKSKKKSGGFGIFKTALSMMRRTSRTKPNPINHDNSKWTNLVDSVRPLHHVQQDNNHMIQSPKGLISSSFMADDDENHHDHDHDHVHVHVGGNFNNIVDGMVMGASSPAPSSSTCTMSQYASAVSLRDLVDEDEDEEEEEDPDEVFDTLCGDEMIDAKAEEFIAQFYNQIRLQNHHGAGKCY